MKKYFAGNIAVPYKKCGLSEDQQWFIYNLIKDNLPTKPFPYNKDFIKGKTYYIAKKMLDHFGIEKINGNDLELISKLYIHKLKEFGLLL